MCMMQWLILTEKQPETHRAFKTIQPRPKKLPNESNTWKKPAHSQKSKSHKRDESSVSNLLKKGKRFSHMLIIFNVKLTIGAFDLKQHFAEWSRYEIKPRERFECIGSDCFLITLAVLLMSYILVIILRSAASSRTRLYWNWEPSWFNP